MRGARWAGSALVLAATLAQAQGGPAVTALPALRLSGALPAVADFTRPFDTPLPLRVRGAAGTERIELQHCRDWLTHRTQAVGSDNDAAWRVVLVQTVPCEAMALLAAAKPAAHSGLPADLTQLRDTRSYPGSLWPTPSPDEQARVAASGKDLGRLSGMSRWQRVPVQPATTPPQQALRLSTAAWQLSLTALARGDFDGDGWEDAAYLWQAASRRGSLTDARLVVLTRMGGQGGQGGQGALKQLPSAALLAALPAPR